MSRLLLSDLLDAIGKRTLEKYVKKLQNGAVEVEYTNKELGRLEAKMTSLKKGETCYTQMNLYNIMKAVGCRDIYTDVDIKNCHPTLLAQLFEAEGCDTKYLSMYVDSRQELIEQMGVPKVAIKQLMFGLIYIVSHRYSPMLLSSAFRSSDSLCNCLICFIMLLIFSNRLAVVLCSRCPRVSPNFTSKGPLSLLATSI
eukprot:COSAG03_NODE_52_length_16230_cov_22.987168_23_plen_198_part_00